VDLLANLRLKIDRLSEGEYTLGLRAVLLHIETAFRHLSRGQDRHDETAFTDAIYRTNQAFEGGIKEAYRVLAGKDPAKMRLHEMECYLEHTTVFRPRVLKQFANYRSEWRNPAAHDYRLDFDESEAFLAIISVSAFACLLVDELAKKISYLKSKAEAESRKADIEQHLARGETDLLKRTADILRQFFRIQRSEPAAAQTQAQLEGAIEGFFSATVPDLLLRMDEAVDTGSGVFSDFVVSDGSSRVLIDLKPYKTLVESGLVRLESHLAYTGLRDGILFVWGENGADLKSREHHVSSIDGRILILEPIPPEKRPIDASRYSY